MVVASSTPMDNEEPSLIINHLNDDDGASRCDESLLFFQQPEGKVVSVEVVEKIV